MRRLKNFLIKSNYSSATRLDLRRRHPKLRSLEGWYNASPLLSRRFHQLYNQFLELKIQNKTQLKFTKWLNRNSNLNIADIQEVGINIKKTKFKISCDYNDILRVIESPHYKTCFNENIDKAKQLLKYLSDPDIAVIYVPDTAGHMKWRAFVRLIKMDSGKFGLLVYQWYGNANHKAILNKLSQIMPVFINTNNLKSSFELKSASKINNKNLKKNFWSDAYYRIKNNRFYFKGDIALFNLTDFEYNEHQRFSKEAS